MVPEPEQVLSFEWRIMAIVLAALMMVEAVTLLVNINGHWKGCGKLKDAGFLEAETISFDWTPAYTTCWRVPRKVSLASISQPS